MKLVIPSKIAVGLEQKAMEHYALIKMIGFDHKISLEANELKKTIDE